MEQYKAYLEGKIKKAESDVVVLRSISLYNKQILMNALADKLNGWYQELQEMEQPE